MNEFYAKRSDTQDCECSIWDTGIEWWINDNESRGLTIDGTKISIIIEKQTINIEHEGDIKIICCGCDWTQMKS